MIRAMALEMTICERCEVEKYFLRSRARDVINSLPLHTVHKLNQNGRKPPFLGFDIWIAKMTGEDAIEREAIMSEENFPD
jgi:hypothetical protein